MNEKVINVFIVGAKGMGNYGGYETFVDKLTEYHKNNEKIKYHVAWKAKDNKEFIKNNARCFNIKVPNIGPAQAIYYDIFALKKVCKYVKMNRITNFIVYILACRIGPFMNHYVKKIHKLGGKVYVNPDGHEWMRAKWSKPIKKYWKISERLMVKHADLLICDSLNIEKYIKKTYKKYNPNTTFIAYGAETRRSLLNDNDKKLIDWYNEKKLKKKQYYLVVGRFVPENNYEIMIKEFMKSNTKKDFAIITNVNDKFLSELEQKLHYKSDSRIKFVGTVYDKELLMKIRENAYAYLHGHEVGGTNPSLLEALGSTELNLLLDVGFNREVAEDAALYWNKNNGNLAKLIEKTDKLSEFEIMSFSKRAKNRIKEAYSWELISNKYKEEFTRKKVLIVTALSGFIRSFLKNDIEIYQNMGYEVYCASNSNHPGNDGIKSFFEEKKVKFYQISFSSNRPVCYDNIKSYFELKKMIEKNKFDVVHVHTPITGVIVRQICKKYRKYGLKVLYTTHGFFFHNRSSKKNKIIFGGIEKHYSKYSDGIITINNEDYKTAKKMKCKNVFKINGVGVDIEKFRNVKIDRQKYRKSLGIKKNEIVVLSVGELSKRKNQQVVIKAIGLLNNKNVIFVHCGNCMNKQNTFNELKEIAKNNEVRAIFLGLRKDIPEICKCSDIGTISSTREGLGLAGIEMLASGLPVVGSNVHGIVDYLKDGKNGYLADPYDEYSFKDSIERIIDSRYNLYDSDKISHSVDQFDIRYSKEQLTKIYYELLDDKSNNVDLN